MPLVEIEFTRTRYVEISENGVVEANVPKHVLDSGDVETWLSENYSSNTEFAKKVDAAAEADDESEKVDWHSAEQIS